MWNWSHLSQEWGLCLAQEGPAEGLKSSQKALLGELSPTDCVCQEEAFSSLHKAFHRPGQTLAAPRVQVICCWLYTLLVAACCS